PPPAAAICPRLAAAAAAPWSRARRPTGVRSLQSTTSAHNHGRDVVSLRCACGKRSHGGQQVIENRFNFVAPALGECFWNPRTAELVAVPIGRFSDAVAVDDN